ncbi:MAG: laccase domain-containing protein, partial [Firmicutes bacterium]|nr:laccase domain-containing protein [Bacillota bacterium]
MIKKEIEELQIFCFENIEQEGVCRHGFTSRAGGVSPEPYASLNLSYTRGDKKENVNENFSRVAKAIGFELSQLVSAKADHGTCVVRAVKDEKGA